MPAKQVVWEALSSSANGLSKEQVAAIMANIQGLSSFNPANIVVTPAPTPGSEAGAEVIVASGVGLIRWGDLELAALMHNIRSNDLFSPFFSEESLTPYNGDGVTVVDGDMFFELADANGVSKKADDLLNLEIRKIISNIDDTGFRIGENATTVENAVNYFYNHLVLTDGVTLAPAEYVDFANQILEEFEAAPEPAEEEPVDVVAEPDPSCVDGFKRNPAGTMADLLDMIESATRNRFTKSPVYGSALSSSNISALYDGRDAFAFVAAMMRASGFHTDYPVATAADVASLGSSQAWKLVVGAATLENIKDSDLKIGDVLIESVAGGHTMIYIGEQDFNDDGSFVMANTGNSFPYYVDRDVDRMRTYNVWRRQTLPREQN
jgi:hypothetical protein